MRNFILVSITALFVTSCSPSEYSISGTISGVSEGSAILVTSDLHIGQLDTLADEPIFNHQFQIKGHIDEPVVAMLFLSTKEMEAQFPIFVENEKYTLDINVNNSIQGFIHGSKNQELLNRFISLIDDAQMKEINELFMLYEKAQDKEDVKSMVNIENELKAIETRINHNKDSLVRMNFSNPVSAFTIMEDIRNYDDSTLVDMYNRLEEPALSSIYGKRIASHVQLVCGKTAPDFTLTSSQRTPVTMSAIQSKAKILYFWSSESVPCHIFNNQMLDIYRQYKGRGLEILGISLDVDTESWINSIEQDTLSWTQVVDTNHIVEDLYCIYTIPHFILLDEKNTIAAKNIYGDALKNKIETLLAK